MGGCLGRYPGLGGYTSVVDVWLGGSSFIVLKLLIGEMSC